MNEIHNSIVGTLLQQRKEEHESAVRRLADIKRRSKDKHLRYVMMMDRAEIHTNSPERWLAIGAVIVRELTPTGEEKPRRGRPRKHP